MPRSKTYIPLDVFINGRHVGQLNRESSAAVNFRYADSWIEWTHAFPISLSLPLRTDRYVGAPVLAVLENLLPDNDAIRRRISERVRADGTDAYSLLAAIGRDCVGALQFLPEGTKPTSLSEIQAEPVNARDIAAMLRGLGTNPLGIRIEEDFRISIAGAQEKTALLQRNKKWYKPLGTTPTTHILKRPIGALAEGIDLSDSVENEHFCMTFLKHLGLPVASTSMTSFEDEKVLVIERFDRRWTDDGRLLRLPQEDFCQATAVPPSRKYEADGGPGIPDILRLLNGSDAPLDDQRTFLKTTIAFWLLGATDGHAKNFSIRLFEGARFELTPIYDVVSAQPLVDAGKIRHNKFKLAMAVGNSRHYVVNSIVPRHFIESAERGGVGRIVVEWTFRGLQDEAEKALEKTIASMPADFPGTLANSIQRGVESRLKFLK